MKKRDDDIAGWLEKEIIAFAEQSPLNSLGEGSGQRAVGRPFVGIARGSDPLFRLIKEEIGDFYWTPAEIFERTFPESKGEPDYLSVVCWILPQTEATRKSNRLRRKNPAEQWVRAKHHGREFNRNLREFIVDILNHAGYPTVAPVASPDWQWLEHHRHGYASPWSERHVAYVCGLGTFGLCEGLITAAGKAVRIGSVVTAAEIPPTPRPYDDHHAYCLYYRDGSCLECIERCPAAAISPEGHDKRKCREFAHKTADRYEKKIKLNIPACGLCQTRVPCESQIP